MRGRNGEVVFPQTDIGIRIFLTQLLAYNGNLFANGLIVGTIDHQLAIAVTTRRHRSHQTVAGRCSSHAGSNPFDLRILHQQFRHLDQILPYPVRVGLCRQGILHHKLLVVEIREEEVLHLGHGHHTHHQQDKSGQNGALLIGDQESDGPTNHPVHR